MCLQWNTGGLIWFSYSLICRQKNNNDKSCKLVWKLKLVTPSIYFVFFNPLSNILHFYSSNWTWKVSGNWRSKPAVGWVRLSSKSGFSLTPERWHSMFQMIKANLLRLELNVVHLKVVCTQNVAGKCGKSGCCLLTLKETKHTHVISTLRKGIKAM